MRLVIASTAGVSVTGEGKINGKKKFPCHLFFPSSSTLAALTRYVNEDTV